MSIHILFMFSFLHMEPADPWVRADPTDEHTQYEKAEEQTYICLHSQIDSSTQMNNGVLFFLVHMRT